MNTTPWLSLALAALVFEPLLCSSAFAAWPSDPAVNVPVALAPGVQYIPAIVADGAGGVIVAWHDYRSGPPNVYTQHVRADGTLDPAWGGSAGAILLPGATQFFPSITTDGNGGAFVAWYDNTAGHYDVLAVRILANGSLVPPAGLQVCATSGDQTDAQIVYDGAGGAIVAWTGGNGTTAGVQAHHVLANGTLDPAWPATGRDLSTSSINQQAPVIASDGAGGAFVAWSQTNPSTLHDVYAQHVLANGSRDPAWPAGAVAVSTALDEQYRPVIVPDGSGGLILAWEDVRSTIAGDIYAQHVLASGVVDPAWNSANGRGICLDNAHQGNPAIASDGAGGALIAWQDQRGGGSAIYAQRLRANGLVDPGWPVNGLAVSATGGDAEEPEMLAVGAGHAIVTWQESRGAASGFDVYAHRLVATGVDVGWPAMGRALCIAAGGQYYPAIAGDAGQGAIVAWVDARNGINYDLYAQRVRSNGQLGDGSVGVRDLAASLALDPLRPNPARRGAMSVSFALPEGAPASLELLDVAGRRIATQDVGRLGAGRHTIHLDGPRAPGVYLVRLRQGRHEHVRRVALLD